jgi:hypothetical protein
MKTRLLVCAVLAAAGTQLQAQTNTFPASGNVGIGTTSPSAPLEVNGKATVDGGLGVGAPVSAGNILRLTAGTTGPGTITVSSGLGTVSGSGTGFTSTFRIGDTITANSETHTIAAIANDTSLTTDNWTNSASAAGYTLAGGSQVVLQGNGMLQFGNANQFSADVIPASIFVDQSYTNQGAANWGIAVENSVARTSSDATTTGRVMDFISASDIGSANTQNWTTSVGGGSLVGGRFAPGVVSGQTGTITAISGIYAAPWVGNSGTVTNAYGIWVDPETTSGATLTNAIGVAIANNATAVNNTDLLVGTVAAPAGNYALYSSSAYPSSFTGNVGIGTTTPVSKLDARGGITAATTDYAAGTGGSAIQIQQTAFSGNNPSYIQAYTAGATAYGNIGLNPQGGNVGIGTTSPAEVLDVKGNIGVEPGGVIKFWQDASRGAWAQLAFDTAHNAIQVQRSIVDSVDNGDSLGTPGIRWGNVYAVNGNFTNASFSGNLTVAGTFSADNLSGTGTTSLQSITTTGNVGIGTASSQWPLDINGFGARITSGNGNAAQLDLAQTAGGHDWALASWGNTAGGGTLSDKFSIYDNTAGGSRLTIDSSGNVGIGTTSPGYLLDVNGQIHAKEVIVDTTGADYVFAPNYKLMPLSQVEQAIKKTQHLPEIPSAQEMSSGGMSVGILQTKLLAKVEELTLLMIQQDKKMQQQNETLRQQSHELQELKAENTAMLERLNTMAK